MKTLKKYINYVLIVLLFFSISFGSCEDGVYIKPYDQYISDNFENYEDIRKMLIDTLGKWKKDSLVNISFLFFDDAWQVDSILLFNGDSSRFYTTINVSSKHRKNATSDFIKGMTGAKINDKWYFHLEENRYVSRHGLKSDIYSAMSFEEISYVSHTRAMSRLLKIDKEGQYFIDYDEMENNFFKAYKSSYPNIDKIDSVLLKRIAAYKKKKLDVKLIERVKEKRLNSVRPDDPEINNKSLWDKIFGKEEVGLFETEAWKNRRKN